MMVYNQWFSNDGFQTSNNALPETILEVQKCKLSAFPHPPELVNQKPWGIYTLAFWASYHSTISPNNSNAHCQRK